MTDQAPDDIFALFSRFDLDGDHYRVFAPTPSAQVEERRSSSSTAVLTAAPAIAESAVTPRHTIMAAPQESSELLSSAALQSLWRHVGSNRGGQSLTTVDALAAASVNVCGVAGGVGATTISAILTRLIARSGHRCGIFDDTEDPTLPIFFGAQRSADDHRRFSGLHALFQPRVRILNRQMFEPANATDRYGSSLIERHFESLAEQFEHLIFDQPARYSDTSGAGLKIYVAAPDLTSLGRMQKIIRNSGDASSQQIICVLNRFNAASTLHNEIFGWYQESFRELFVIHESPLVTEALAEGTTVVDWAPESPVATDFVRLFGALSRHLKLAAERIPVCS